MDGVSGSEVVHPRGLTLVAEGEAYPDAGTLGQEYLPLTGKPRMQGKSHTPHTIHLGVRLTMEQHLFPEQHLSLLR